MPSRARCRCLRNTPSVTSGNIDPAPATAVPFVPHKNPHSAAPQKHQTRAPPAPGPIFRKMDVPPSAATRCGQSRLAPVVAALFVPSPYAQCTNSRCGLCSKFLSRNLDFHHRLLGISGRLPSKAFQLEDLPLESGPCLVRANAGRVHSEFGTFVGRQLRT